MSLCLKVRGPFSAAAVGLMVSPTTTWAEFCQLLKSELSINEPIDVLYGFPAAVHSYPDEQQVGSILSTNESIRVQLSTVAGHQAQGTSKVKPPAAKKKAAKPAPSVGSAGFGAKIAGLKTESSQKSFKANSPNKRPLGASSSSSTQEPAAKRRRKSSSSSKISSEHDIAEHLVSAVSGGVGTQNRAARKVFRSAVAHQYSSTQAVHRVNAIYAGKYTMRECGGRSLVTAAGNSSYSHIEVAYNKGAGSRSQHVETVELLSKDLLHGVLKVAVLGEDGRGGGSEDAREVLKPMNLSRCSPRIFWSLVFHYGPDLVGSIRSVLQGVDDCAWLDERKKELSEKARINQQQKEEQEAAKAARKAAKDKGKSTAGATTTASPGTAPPPTSSGSSEESKPAYECDAFTTMLLRLVAAEAQLDDLAPHDWRGAVRSYLESDSGGDHEVTRLARLECSSKLRNAITSIRSESAAGTVTLSLDQLESWITSAQMQVFHIVWRCICGGGSERLRSALQRLRIRVPKEFRVWRSAPEGLLQGLLDFDVELVEQIACTWPVAGDNNTSSACRATTTSALTVEKVQWMCAVSQAAQSLFPWMNHDGLAEVVQNTGDQDPTEEDADADADPEADEGEEGWLYSTSAHAYIGHRARIVVENGYWEDGIVVGYLPPEPDEPMALWRVSVDASPEDKRVGKQDRREDLEEHEVEEAIARV